MSNIKMYITAIAIIIAAIFINSNSGCESEPCCDKFEQETDCAGPCQKTCNPPDNERICLLYCLEGCVCKEGLVRISKDIDQCVPEILCPFLAPFLQSQTSCYPCSKYSRYTTCGSQCPETCNPSEYAAALCSADQKLVGCVCNPGFVKISNNINICVPKYLCKFLLPYTKNE